MELAARDRLTPSAPVRGDQPRARTAPNSLSVIDAKS